jgi:hypothetical protein
MSIVENSGSAELLNTKCPVLLLALPTRTPLSVTSKVSNAALAGRVVSSAAARPAAPANAMLPDLIGYSFVTRIKVYYRVLKLFSFPICFLYATARRQLQPFSCRRS